MFDRRLPVRSAALLALVVASAFDSRLVAQDAAPAAPAPAQDAPKSEAPKQDAPKPDAPKPETPKQDAPKSEPAKPEPAKPDAPKPDAASPDAPKNETAKPARLGLEHCFAPDAQAFVAIDDVDALLAEWKASAWGKLFLDEKSAAVRAAFEGVLEAATKESVAKVGVDLVEAASHVKGRLGGAMGADLAAVAADGPTSANATSAGAAVVADVGEHGGELLEKITAAMQKSAERGEGVVKQATAKTGDYTMLASNDATDGKGGFVGVAAVGETLAFGKVIASTAEQNRFTRLLEGIAGEGGESLASQADFRESLAAKPGGVKLMFDTGATMRVSLEQQRRTIERFGEQKQMAPYVERMKSQLDSMRALGLGELGRLTGRVVLDAHGSHVEAHQAWSGGWLPKLAQAWLASDDGALLKLVPADAMQALTIHLDFAAGMDMAAAAAKELKTVPFLGIPLAGGEDAPAATPDTAAPGAEAPFNPRKDVLDHLDGRLVLFTAVVDESEALPGGLFDAKTPTNAALVLGVKNAEALRATVDKLLRQQGLHAIRKRSEFEGFEVFALPLGPVTVSYAIVDDFLVVSASPTLLQDVLRRKSHVELPNLKSNAVFQKQFDGLTHAPSVLLWAKLTPSEAASAVGHTIVPKSHPGLKPSAGNDDNGDDGNDEPDGAPEPASAPDSLEGRFAAFLEAIDALDPKFVAETVPSGSVAGLSVAKEGVTVEGVSR